MLKRNNIVEENNLTSSLEDYVESNMMVPRVKQIVFEFPNLLDPFRLEILETINESKQAVSMYDLFVKLMEKDSKNKNSLEVIKELDVYFNESTLRKIINGDRKSLPEPICKIVDKSGITAELFGLTYFLGRMCATSDFQERSVPLIDKEILDGQKYYNLTKEGVRRILYGMKLCRDYESSKSRKVFSAEVINFFRAEEREIYDILLKSERPLKLNSNPLRLGEIEITDFGMFKSCMKSLSEKKVVKIDRDKFFCDIIYYLNTGIDEEIEQSVRKLI